MWRLRPFFNRRFSCCNAQSLVHLKHKCELLINLISCSNQIAIINIEGETRTWHHICVVNRFIVWEIKLLSFTVGLLEEENLTTLKILCTKSFYGEWKEKWEKNTNVLWVRKDRNKNIKKSMLKVMSDLLTCIESAEIISALKRRASSIDNFVLPVPVEPSITIKGTFRNIISVLLLLTFVSEHENFFAKIIFSYENSLNWSRWASDTCTAKHYECLFLQKLVIFLRNFTIN